MAPTRSTRRCAIKEKCIMNSLPRELIEQVFLRLPASCLLRCIGVCKMWCIIIRDSQFAIAHLEHVPRCILLFSPKQLISGTLCPSDAVIFDEAWSPSTWAAPVIGPDDLLCGTLNGLLCLHTPTSTLKIANLATGECLHLKKPTKSLKHDHFSFYRFGFHPVTKEYKVIHFLQEIGPFAEDRFNIIQVYTLGDEKWKDIVTPEALSLNCVKNSGVVIVDGTMYWLIEDAGSNWEHAVMSFDLGEGSFAQIQLPAVELEDWAYSDGRNYWVAEINGKVCVSTAHSLDRMIICELQVWALNEGVDQRWSHMYSIQLRSTFARRLHFVNGDKILIQDRYSNLYSYELIGKNFQIELSKMVKLFGLRHGDDDLQLCACVKSVVHLDLYAKGAVVRSPKTQGGWKLEKWKAWQYKDFNLEKMLRKFYQIELDMLELTQRVRTRVMEIAQHLPDELIQQRVSMEIDRILQRLPDCPDPFPTPVRRLNWVGRMENMKKLMVYVDGVNDKTKVFQKAQEDIMSTLRRVGISDAFCQKWSILLNTEDQDC